MRSRPSWKHTYAKPVARSSSAKVSAKPAAIAPTKAAAGKADAKARPK